MSIVRVSSCAGVVMTPVRKPVPCCAKSVRRGYGSDEMAEYCGIVNLLQCKRES